MSVNSTFKTPYLRYEVPTDMVKIQAEIKKMKSLSAAKKPTPVDPRLNTPSHIAPKGDKKPASQIVVSPNGNVLLGFNCEKMFIATNNFFADASEWRLLFKNQITGLFEWVSFMGFTATPFASNQSIGFTIDYSTYAQAAYIANNGKATFKVFCQGYNWGLPGEAAESPEITLDFSADTCNAIQQLTLNMDCFEGGNNAPNPVMTVFLAEPAPPGGQRIVLNVSNANLGNIMGNGDFFVPAGQKSQAFSWFLGTRRVYTTGKCFDIIAQLSTASGLGPRAYATVKLTKKQK
jgi:hypothetical protein